MVRARLLSAALALSLLVPAQGLLQSAGAQNTGVTPPIPAAPIPSTGLSLFVPGDPLPDAPELSARGEYTVGVQTLNLVHKGQQDINTAVAQKLTTLPTYDRPLRVEVWYPARTDNPNPFTLYPDVLGSGPGDPKRPNTPFSTLGRAARGAQPDTSGGAYPLVIVSHGYPGSRVLLSYLCENLASKGYVVAAIDHTDSTHGDKGAFASTLVNRPLDDNFVLGEMARLGAAGSGSFLSGVVNADTTAIVGYSMGGYGALNAAGAGFAPNMAPLVPGGAFTQRETGNYAVDPRIKAVVAFAPWGGDYAVRAIGVTFGAQYGFWDAQGLAGLKVPTLFVVGSKDDVAGYTGGVKSLFENAVNSDRYMVVYDNASHNSAPNPPPAESYSNFDEFMHYAEPTWGSARLNNLNEHFVTAFLNYRLKGMAGAADYLNVKVPLSNDGVYSRNADGTPKPDNTYWPGFRPRTALGIELYHLGAK